MATALVSLFAALMVMVSPAAAAVDDGQLVGYTTHDANAHQADYSDAGQMEAFLTPSSTLGDITTMHIYVASNNSADTIFLAVYYNANGKPGDTMDSCAITSVTNGAWNTCVFHGADSDGGDHVVASTQFYWLGIMSPYGHGAVRYYDTYYGSTTYNGGPSLASYSTAATTLASCPQPFGTTTQNWGNSPAEFYGG